MESFFAFSSAWAAIFWQSAQEASAAVRVVLIPLPLAPQIGLPVPGVAMWRVVVFLLAFAVFVVLVVIFVLLLALRWLALRFGGVSQVRLEHMDALERLSIKLIR